MSLTIVLGGTGDTTHYMNELCLWFDELGVSCVGFDDSEVQDKCVNGDGVSRVDLVRLHREEYDVLHSYFDVVILDKSFVDVIVDNDLFDEENSEMEYYVSMELDNICPLVGDRSVFFNVLCDVDGELNSRFVELSHYLVLEYHLDSNVLWDLGDGEFTFCFDFIKSKLGFYLFET